MNPCTRSPAARSKPLISSLQALALREQATRDLARTVPTTSSLDLGFYYIGVTIE
jgi:hypothetical protein